MSNHDPLEAPQWDDVVSSNPAKPNLESSIVDELSATFAQTAVTEPEQEEDEEDEQDDEQATEEQHEEPEREEEVTKSEVPKSPVQDTTELFSTLTDSPQDSSFKNTIVSPKKDESLFEKSPRTANSLLPSIDLESADNEKSQSTEHKPSSPNRLRRQNVYRAPRFRRNPIKKEPADSNEESSADPLGPLGAPLEDPLKQEQEPQAEPLLKQSEAPLFEINRTPLSPLKFTEPKSEPEETETEAGSSTATTAATSLLNNKTIKLNISVGDPTKVGDITSAHIVYSVRTIGDHDLLKSQDTVVTRRYRDFRWLYRQLQQTHPGRIIPPPPEKQAVGRFNQSFIEHRRFALERMLVKIGQNIHLQTDPDFIMFLQSERFSSEAREHEKALGTNSTFNENESNDGSLNGSGGFLSSIGGAFSFTPKVSEPDEYFKDKKSYIEALDQQLKTFSRNLETVVLQRQDLSSVTEEFSNIVSTLADLEVSKVSSELFQEFANTQSKIKDLLDRLSLQDMLTLGTTLDEYQRVISSIRSTFDLRDKILLQLSKSESDLKKKQSSYDKNFKYNRTQTDKLDLLKQELSALETKNQTTKEKFKNISKVIVEELKTFEFEKIHDFRNSIEIFLESTIESQKEAVELWESFYNNSLSAPEPETAV